MTTKAHKKHHYHSPWNRGLYSLVLLVGVLTAAAPAQAQEAASQPAPEVPAVTYKIGRLKIDGSGDYSENNQELNIRAQLRDLFHTHWFVSGEGKLGRDLYRDYDLTRVGAQAAVGRALDGSTDLTASYRLEEVNVFHVSPDATPAYRNAAGRNTLGILGLSFNRDQRDDSTAATRGTRVQLTGELAWRGVGSSDNFGRLESDFSFYATPWKDLTLVEHLRLGWMEDFGPNDEVPFFERYFVGGSSTVRGHRGRWLTPRGIDDQFIGGEIEAVNNVEARWPILKELFHRRLTGAVFFDAGRAFRRFSDVGEFGYGLGAGLRYAVHCGPIQGVLRADMGFNPDPKEDDSTANLHITFGMPF